MGYPTAHGPAMALVILLAACGTPESSRNPVEPADVTSLLPVTVNQVVIHVDDGATPGGNGSGRFPFRNLPEAVAAAHAIAGAVVIKVEPGDYPLAGPLVIDRPLDLRGSTEQVDGDDPWPTGEAAAGTETRIYASNPLGSYSLMVVGRSDGGVLTGVRLSGFVFEGTTTGAEVRLTRVQDYWVRDNVFRAPANFAMESIASSGRVTGNHYSGASTGAVFAAGYPASPSTVVFTGNRAVRNTLGGLLLIGASYDLPELGDALDAIVRDNDLSDNTVNPNFAFGLRLFLLRRDPTSQSSGQVHARVEGNRIHGNRIGISIDAGFPYRQVGTVCDTRVYSGEIDLTLAGNTVTGSLLTPGLVTFTRNAAALTPSMLPQWQYLHATTFMISDGDGTLADAWIDHPATDPFVGPCPGDAAHEPLENVLIYNGDPLLQGRNF
jgi:hypothetical protein